MTRTQYQRFVLILTICVGVVGSTSVLLAKKGKSSKSSQKKSVQSAPPPPPTTSPADAQDADVQKAIADMTAAEAKVKKTFESSGDWASAADDVAKTQHDYDTASAAAQTKAEANPEYVAARTKVSADEVKLYQAQEGGADTSDAIAPAAKDLLAARSAFGAMNAQVLASDPAAADTRRRLTDANIVMEKLRAMEVTAVHADPDWQAAKQALDDARSKLASASK